MNDSGKRLIICLDADGTEVCRHVIGWNEKPECHSVYVAGVTLYVPDEVAA